MDNAKEIRAKLDSVKKGYSISVQYENHGEIFDFDEYGNLFSHKTSVNISSEYIDLIKKFYGEPQPDGLTVVKDEKIDTGNYEKYEFVDYVYPEGADFIWLIFATYYGGEYAAYVPKVDDIIVKYKHSDKYLSTISAYDEQIFSSKVDEYCDKHPEKKELWTHLAQKQFEDGIKNSNELIKKTNELLEKLKKEE